ncbi:DUF779 domain-containing protein [Nocardia asteroides]|uniref:DUF779 domain-containing protein n=1 Tax=Nocardia asteroides TaxID=1824 RepID=UPI001E3CAE40|nr:DUF779 domain-containing protein [Nocardia asteroides]UGT54845.1 DUF779 domain-containing protein [Nocardia asteroides]
MPNHAGSAHRERPPHIRNPAHRHRAVATTDDAGRLLRLLTEMHGPVVLYLPPDSDGHTPICVRHSDFQPESGDVLAGRTAAHAEFWMAESFHAGLDDLDVSIDVRTVPAADRSTASLDTACGFRFALRIQSAEDANALVEEAS